MYTWIENNKMWFRIYLFVEKTMNSMLFILWLWIYVFWIVFRSNDSHELLAIRAIIKWRKTSHCKSRTNPLRRRILGSRCRLSIIYLSVAEVNTLQLFSVRAEQLHLLFDCGYRNHSPNVSYLWSEQLRPMDFDEQFYQWKRSWPF